MQIFMFICKKKNYVFNKQTVTYCDKCVPVTAAWGVLELRMKERTPDMEGNCE